jgi:hypothetical protein
LLHPRDQIHAQFGRSARNGSHAQFENHTFKLVPKKLEPDLNFTSDYPPMLNEKIAVHVQVLQGGKFESIRF